LKDYARSRNRSLHRNFRWLRGDRPATLAGNGPVPLS